MEEELMAILKKGLSGEAVRRLQTKLGVKADGEFGPNTEKALRVAVQKRSCRGVLPRMA